MNLLDIAGHASPDLHAEPSEAESSVIGGLLMYGKEAYDAIGGALTADKFRSWLCRTVFSAVETMILDDKTVDIITVHDELKRSGVDGVELPWLNDLQASFVGMSSMRAHVGIVLTEASEAALRGAAAEVSIIACDNSIPVIDRISKAQDRLEAVVSSKGNSDPQQIGSFVVSLLDRLQSYADGTVAPGIPTQIPTLDNMLGGGLRGGKQIIIAARPSVGKSSLAQQLCINVARQGHASALLSMEMSCDELTDRATANLGRVPLECMATGKMGDSEWGRVVDAVEQMRSLPLFFDGQAALSLADITVKARYLKRKHNLKLLAIDYLQLCSSGKPKESRHHQIEEISRGLKSLAKQLDITIITLSQLNREVEKRQGGRPMLSDLKESGAIEEDADVVLMMWRHRADEHSSLIGLAVPKNRQGRVGEVPLHFEGQYQRWSESTESLSKLEPSRAAGRASTYADDF